MCAVCSICGDVKIRKTPATKNPVCKNRYNARRKEYRSGIVPTRIPKEYAPAILRETVHRSRAKKLGQLPVTADVCLMKNIYIFCPRDYEVDHIKSLAFGGEHHQDNLQYLPTKENRHKYSGDNYDKSKAIDWRKVVN